MAEEFLAGKVGLLYSFCGEFGHHFCFRGNCGMVCAGHPQCILPLHTRTADEDVLYGIVEHMAHMEHARNVGRRNHYAVWVAVVGL